MAETGLHKSRRGAGRDDEWINPNPSGHILFVQGDTLLLAVKGLLPPLGARTQKLS